MISKTSLLLTLLALSVNFVSAITQAQCSTLCTNLQKVPRPNAATLNVIGVTGDKCGCKNPQDANSALICRKFQNRWDIDTLSTCKALQITFLLGGFKSYDYNNIGKNGDTCYPIIISGKTKLCVKNGVTQYGSWMCR